MLFCAPWHVAFQNLVTVGTSRHNFVFLGVVHDRFATLRSHIEPQEQRTRQGRHALWCFRNDKLMPYNTSGKQLKGQSRLVSPLQWPFKFDF